MRTPQKAIRRNQVASTLSVSAPVGGWNARNPLSEMKPTDAVVLDNFFCTPYDVTVRKGYSQWATGLTGTVNTIVSYSPSSGNPTLFAAAGANIYDVSAPGVVGAPVVSGNALDKWQHVNFGTSGGNFLVMVDGTDSPLIYNGTGWGNMGSTAFPSINSLTSSGTTATVTTASAHGLKTGQRVVVAGYAPAGYNGTYVATVTSPTTFTYVLPAAVGATTTTGTITPQVTFTVTGIDPKLFISVMAFKARLWFAEKNSLRAWYLPTSSLGGAAQQLDLSSLFNRGGYLMDMGDWSLDAGYGLDDYAVFISSEGQVAVYKGTDPASATTFALIGVYDIGSPIGRRCLMKYSGDLTVICKDGLFPLSKALLSTRVSSQDALTDKIQQVTSDYVTLYGANFGWEAISYPGENMLMLNVPISTSQSYQLVMNTISGAWSRFIGYNAASFELHNDLLYFGSTGMVCRAYDGYTDAGANIAFDALSSFNYFGRHAQLKKVNMLRVVITTDGSPTLLLGVNADFDESSPQGTPTFTPTSSNLGIWDSSLWDVSVWAADATVKRDWQTAFAMGYCLAVHMKGTTRGTKLRWASTDYLITPGGVI